MPAITWLLDLCRVYYFKFILGLVCLWFLTGFILGLVRMLFTIEFLLGLGFSVSYL